MQPIAVAAVESPVITIRTAATAKVNVQRLRGNVNVLTGSGGNITVPIGRDGKVLVDAGTTASRPQITAALASLSDNPVNSHWHFDHTDGNEWLHSIGAEITAHESTRKHLSVTTRVEDWNFTFPPAPCRQSYSKANKLFISTAQRLRLRGIPLLTRIPISQYISQKLTLSMWPILSGTAISHSLITQPEAVLPE